MSPRSVVFACALWIAGVTPSLAQTAAVQQLYQKAHAAQEAGQQEQAIADYRELLRLDPSIAPAYNNLGRLYFNAGRLPEAIATLQKGLRLQPDMAPAQVMLGASYLQAGDAEKSLEPLQIGVKAMPDDTFARHSLIRALTRLGRREEAAAQLQELLQRDPNDQESWYLLGKLQLEQSQASFARVHEINANSAIAHQLSGEIMESMKNTPGAVAEYKQAIALAPQDLDALSHLANLYWSTGDWAQALPLLKSYSQQSPSDCFGHWKLANTLYELQSPAENILPEAKAALDLCPDLAQARVERARALLTLDRAREALPELKLAEQKAPDEPSIQFLLARVYKSLGEPALAASANARFQQLQKAEHEASEKHAADVIDANR